MVWAIILGLIGGLGLFVYGMHLMSDSLQRLTLSRLKVFFERMTNTRIKGLFVGTFVTSLIQSSSATSVIVVGLVNAGILSFTRAIPVLIGANIGTTITAQLITLKLTSIAPLFVGAGAIGYLMAKKQKHKKIGLIILGFGLLFLGLKLMSSSVEPLSGNQFFKDMFTLLGANPLLGVLLGLIVTVILQSSSSTIAMVIALAIVGLIDLRIAIFLILGDNIGTCVTALIASLGGKKAGKKVALFHLLFNIMGAGIALLLLKMYLSLIPLTSPDIARQVANTHTAFNIFNAMLFLPLVPLFVRLINRIIPGEDYGKKETRFLKKELLRAPSLAIDALIKELLVAMGVARGMMHKCRACLKRFDHDIYKEVMIDEDSIDRMQERMTSYVVAITQNEISKEEAKTLPRILHSINDIEKLGDYCENMMDAAQKMYEDDLKLSTKAVKELENLFDLLDEQFDLTSKSVKTGSKKDAERSIMIKEEIHIMAERAAHNHMLRLRNKVCVCSTGIQFTNIITHMQKLSSHLENVAEMALESGK